jgi:chromosome partitioning protein
VNHFPDKVYESMIPRTIRLGEAPSFGKPIIVYDRTGIGATAYRLLAREFLRRHEPPAEAPKAEPTAAPAVAATEATGSTPVVPEGGDAADRMSPA